MTIPLSKVQTLCNAHEVALVQASRRPQLSRLTLTEAKRLVVRTRKHFDKWQDRSRDQSRTSLRSKGVPVAENRSTEKAQVFRDALDALEAQVAKLESQGVKTTGGRSPSPPKTVRNRTHRAERAEMRSELHMTGRKLNGKPAVKTGSEKGDAPSLPAESGAAATTRHTRKLTPPPSPTPKPGTAPPVAGIQPKHQLRARTVAKKNRMAASGKITRAQGHASSRGRRSQGRKDSR